MQLPPMTQQMGANLQAAAATGDLGVWQQTIQYGYALIDTMYRPHPIKRPFDLFRRTAARREWEDLARQTGLQLRQAMMQAILRDFTGQLNAPIDQREWEAQERRRREQAAFDIDQQIRLAKAQAKATTKEQIKVEKVKATLNPPPPPPEDPDGVIADTMAKIDAIEKDPNLSKEQKRRRIEILNRALEIRLASGKR